MDYSKRELKQALQEALAEFFADRVLPGDELLNVGQAARFLNIAETTVYEKTHLKKIPHYKKGKRILFRKAELLEWMETGRVVAIDSSQVQATVNQYLQTKDFRKR